MAFIRKIKKADAVYLATVENYREDGKVKQRVLEYVGMEENGMPVEKVDINKIEAINAKQYADISILYQLAKELNLNYLLGKHHKPIIALLIAHLLCKSSVLKMGKWMEESTVREIIGLDELSTEKLYRSLDYLEECDFEFLEQSIFEYWQKVCPKDNESYVLDVTDTYYNGKHDQSTPRKGKEGRVSKLIQIGLGVSFENGFPIFHKVYNGSISNIKVLEDMMRIMAQRAIKSIIMDRGFYSEANVEDLHRLNIDMILGVKQSIGIKKDILAHIDKEKIYSSKHQVILKRTIVYVQEVEFLFGKLILIYNPKYEALKEDKMLADGATDAKVKFVGFSLIFHNTRLKPGTVVQKYFEKDVVERSFHTMKGDVQLHPIRLWLPQWVNAHVNLCYLSMCLLSLIKFRCNKLGLQPSEVLSELQVIHKVNIKHSQNGKEFTKVVKLTNLQKNILKTLRCSV